MIGLEPLESRLLFTTITVYSTLDTIAPDGVVTLREAITASNTNAPSGDAPAGSPGLDTIAFYIPGAGVRTIALASALPDIVEPVLIDGYTQPGASRNMLAVGNDALLRVELSGAAAGPGVAGLTFTFGAEGSAVRGLVINRFSASGITGYFEGRATFTGNFIGTNADGTAAAGNGGNGISIAIGSADVGGTSPADRNLISGNGGNGVNAEFPDAPSLRVQGNYIGTDRTGTTALGNGRNGAALGAGHHIVGGTDPGAGNLISGNAAHGVILGEGPTNVVQGNLIGTDVTGTRRLGNGGDGVVLSYVIDSLVGGSTAAARNVISGNGGNGVVIADFAASNVVAGNYIGTDASGAAAIGNGADGVVIRNESVNNTIGGTAGGQRNVISANRDDGIDLTTSRAAPGFGNVIQGNYIGTDAGGSAALGNGDDGVYVEKDHDILIGGSDTSARNVIAGNGGDGVEIRDEFGFAVETWNVAVAGNHIGLGAAGNALGNAGDGVRVTIRLHMVFPRDAVPGNPIGGETPGSRNVISANGGDGVSITGDFAYGNVVSGNYIGTDPAGGASAGFGNRRHGVSISEAPRNRVGGTTAGARNVISGNLGRGVSISGVGAPGNTVQGNYVGTTAGGSDRLGNGGGGVVIDAAGANTIGGTVAGARNVISANFAAGVRISGTGPGAGTNVVQGNYIGTTFKGTEPLGNGGPGVGVFSPRTQVGGTLPGAGNVIGGNASDGVLVSGAGVGGVLVSSNSIGLGADGVAPVGNGRHGVLVADGASANSVASNRVAFNAAAGVAVNGATSARNTILSNSIYSNEQLGIDLAADGVTRNDRGDRDAGPNGLQNYPVITSAASGAAGTTIAGTLDSLPGRTYVIQLFSSPAADPSGYGEGQTLLDSFNATTNATGHATFTRTLPAGAAAPVGSVVTATATYLLGGLRVSAPIRLPQDGTSEFSAAVRVAAAVAPALSVKDAAVVEGDQGLRSVGFTVSLSAPSKQPVSVAYVTRDGSAIAGSDYLAAAGVITFAPGETLKVVPVQVVGDLVVEADETFELVLANPAGASIAGSGVGTIVNDDRLAPIDNSLSSFAPTRLAYSPLTSLASSRRLDGGLSDLLNGEAPGGVLVV